MAVMGDTRQRILDAALDLFVERGFDKASLREVADRVGVTKAALYYYFPSKEDLLVALLEPLNEMTTEFLALPDTVDLETWAGGLERLIDWVFAQRGLFVLLESNQAAVTDLVNEDSFLKD